MGLGGAYSYLIRTASAEQIELIVARREHAKQLNDLEAKHDAALVALRQELAAAHAAVKSLRAVNDACRRRLQECDAAMQELQAVNANLRAENDDVRRRLHACDNVNRLIAEVARGETSMLTRGSR
jgi:chromosome segregation ATPase